MRSILLLLLLGACAVVPPPPAPPLPYPPAARERMVRIALAEWADWGRVVMEPGLPGGSTGAESEPANFPRVLAYWRVVPQDEGAIAGNRRRYAAALAGLPEGEALWREPYWSAAFISFVLASAGVDRREFPPSAAHADYVDALIRDAAAFPAAAPFLPRLPRELPPQPGDLLCTDRSRNPIADWRQRAADGGRFRPMHCDIVTGTAPGVVEVVGGNVRDSVTLTRFPADAAGYLLPWPAGEPAWFVLFQNRLGRLPPWSPLS
ncbi:DUF2272 domain-containing protein [Belnapia sp. T6]|uniref:DUF2272 domain-containing protein n=1 Tax=Belnapia mucosa TaxID=2804532 RepID=A0ABS1V432_9PROT|nr:DUF2272 domain-containing protein [Belnapia mucosa]MBL6456431.1 DUF2272 domain-containing protein [Belnapia mucosa]